MTIYDIDHCAFLLEDGCSLVIISRYLRTGWGISWLL